MCYAKPGPRCSAYARRELIAAKKSGEISNILVAQDIYDETREGQEKLEENIRQSRQNTTRDELNARKESASSRRDDKISRYKASLEVQVSPLRKNRDTLQDMKKETIKKVPLKDMKAKELGDAILLESGFTGESREIIKHSIEFATDLHKDQVRKEPNRLSDGTYREGVHPYIEHPLRNTLRLVRWGVKDKEVIMASVLHDTVEDCAASIVQNNTPFDISKLTQEELRSVSLDHIKGKYGQRVSSIVEGVSNPIVDVHKIPREERNQMYNDHVLEETTKDHGVFLVKIADLTDNALGLHNNKPSKMVRRLATKYQPTMAAMSIVFKKHVDSGKLVISGNDDISLRLFKSQDYLQRMIDQPVE